ncbi:methyltransferase domain-containing protein [Panacibacter ginsenosidivorans]|uniref:Methyltransferase domain-containing protein n=1 Tax=Panacibacter ginsenosidivorans TaxID=1813871 RepID=A0A5B8V4P7_9BACT|nr:class I SAM-dependent methyltransferase [Panacibacter ginsenosidivorans]QEC66169.1 methyltransferase domain-containing protein [Panacibacter ginsenosidivorans]
MTLLNKIQQVLKYSFQSRKKVESSVAYNMWASTYDDQPGNMVLHLDEIVVNNLLDNITLYEKIIADIGCGTGRHWQKILLKNPTELIGYDVSVEMLNKLHQKYPAAKTHLLHDNILKELKDASCDMIISTLVVAHIKDLSAAFTEWNRVLKKGAEIIITDFHPESLQNGATRSFRNEDKTIHIKNYIHSLNKIRTLAEEMKWEEISLIEKRIDENVKRFFIGEDALIVYGKSIGTPVLYGFHFRKS